MSRVAYVAVTVITLASLAGLAYMRLPVTRHYRVDDHKHVVVPETVRETVIAKVDGQEIPVEVEYTVDRLVYPVSYRVAIYEPTPLQQVQFWALVIILVIYSPYAIFVLVLWGRDKWNPRRSNENIRDNERRMDGVINLCVGFMMGLAGAMDFTEYPDHSPYHIPISSPQDPHEYIPTEDKPNDDRNGSSPQGIPPNEARGGAL